MKAPPHPLSSRAKPRDLRFHHPPYQTQMEVSPFPLSSRAKPRDLRCAPPNTQILRYQPSTPKQKCHPDRSGGTCCFSTSTNQPPLEAPPHPLSSRAKPRDLRSLYHPTPSIPNKGCCRS